MSDECKLCGGSGVVSVGQKCICKYGTRSLDGSASGVISLNEQYRNGGDMVEDRESGRDSISAMRLAHQRPDVLANALLEMGITENGDEAPCE
jgi:hypothetical protein